MPKGVMQKYFNNFRPIFSVQSSFDKQIQKETLANFYQRVHLFKEI